MKCCYKFSFVKKKKKTKRKTFTKKNSTNKICKKYLYCFKNFTLIHNTFPGNQIFGIL